MALTDNLLSYWKLEEASGTRVDEVGNNDLTDTNGMGNTAGKIGNAGAFVLASSEYLSIASASQSPDLSINGASGDIFISAWVKLNSKPSVNMWPVAKYGFANGNREYAIYWDFATDRFRFRVFNNLAASDEVTASSFGAPSTGTYYHIMAWVDNTANTVNISINNGTVDSVALTVTTHNGGGIFHIGAVGNSTPIEHWDGEIDEVGIWSVPPSSTERTQLYNGGAGLTHPFVSTSGKSMLIFF